MSQNTFYKGMQRMHQYIRRWDWRAILLSFLTACTFWLFHTLNAEHTALLRVPLSIAYDPAKFVLLEEPPTFLEVKASGYGWNLFKSSIGLGVEPIEIRATHRMYGRIGMQPLMPIVSGQLPNLHISALLTDTLDFRLDTILVKQLPIQIDERKVPLAPHVKLVSNIIATPSQIAVKGPASILATTPYQHPVDVAFSKDSLIGTDFDGWLPIDLKKNAYLTIDERVKVRFKVARFSLQAARAKLVLENFPAKHQLAISPDTAHVQYWLMPGHEPLASEVPVILDYWKINWADSSILPQVKLSSKFIEPSVWPEKFRISRREH